MPNVTEEKITTTESNENPETSRPTKRNVSGYQTAGYLVYFVFGVLDVLLGFRFILKLLGANPVSGFVDFIYNLSSVFVSPFVGIFNQGLAKGAMADAVFEPATLIAFIVYAFLAWGIVTLIKVLSGSKEE